MDKYIAEKLGMFWHPALIETHFSQSVPRLKSAAKRAGLWDEFLDFHLEQIHGYNTSGMYGWIHYVEYEFITDPALCAQAFEAFLKEREKEKKG